MAYASDNLTEVDWQMFIHGDPSTQSSAWQYGLESIDDFFAPDAPFWNNEITLNGEYGAGVGGEIGVVGEVGEVMGTVGQGEGNGGGGGGMGGSGMGNQIFSNMQQLDNPNGFMHTNLQQPTPFGAGAMTSGKTDLEMLDAQQPHAPSSAMPTDLQQLTSIGDGSTLSSMPGTDTFSGLQQLNAPSMVVPTPAQQLASFSGDGTTGSIAGNGMSNGMQIHAPHIIMPTYTQQLINGVNSNITGNEMFGGMHHFNDANVTMPTNVQQSPSTRGHGHLQASPKVVISNSELSASTKKAARNVNNDIHGSEENGPADVDEHEYQDFIELAARVGQKNFRRGKLPWVQSPRKLRSTTTTTTRGAANEHSLPPKRTSGASASIVSAASLATGVPSRITKGLDIGSRQPHASPCASLPLASANYHQQAESFYDGAMHQVTPSRPANTHQIAPYPSPAAYQQTLPYPIDGVVPSSPPVATNSPLATNQYPAPPQVSPASFGNVIGSTKKATPKLLAGFVSPPKPARRITRRSNGAEALISEMEDQQTSPATEESTVPFPGFETHAVVPQTKRSRDSSSQLEDPVTPPPKRKKVPYGRGEVKRFTTEQVKALNGLRTRSQKKEAGK